YHAIVGRAFGEKRALLAVEGTIDHVARVNERGRELPIEIGIVLDHGEAQGQCSHCCRRRRFARQNRRRPPLLCHYIRRGERLRKGGRDGRGAATAVGRGRHRARSSASISRRAKRPMRPSTSRHTKHDSVPKPHPVFAQLAPDVVTLWSTSGTMAS